MEAGDKVDTGPTYKAIITAYRVGHRGPYIETNCATLGMITVSLSKDVWRDMLPEKNDCGLEVMLSDIRKKRKGWRAYKARFIRPGDKSEMEGVSNER